MTPEERAEEFVYLHHYEWFPDNTILATNAIAAAIHEAVAEYQSHLLDRLEKEEIKTRRFQSIVAEDPWKEGN